MSTEQGSNIVTRLWRLFWLLVLVGHAMLALFWWWLEPGGFGFEHPYSHLNSFCDFEIRGHRRLSLEFSPCP